MRGSAFCALAVLVLAGCGDDGETQLIDGLFTEAEWDQVQSFVLSDGPPPNPTNRYADNEQVAAFGKKLFFEKRYSGPLTVESELGQVGETGKVGCITCHNPESYFSDSRPDNQTSMGAARTGRNAPSLVNVTYYEWGNWAGAHDTFWKQGANTPETKDNAAGNRLGFAHMLWDHYRDEYNELFDPDLDPALDPAHPDASRFPPEGKPKSSADAPDGPWEMMDPADQIIINTIMANVGKSFEAYERKLVSKNSPFDRYAQGDFSALTASAKRGLKLFIGKAACDACHTGSTFTDQKFHNTGVMQSRDPFDQGRYDDIPKAVNNTFNGASMYSDDPVAGAAKLEGVVQSDEVRGQFRTKSLRHLTATAPYMHDGSLATLEDVVRFYNDGGGTTGFPGTKSGLLVPLNLSSSEISDLVAFLEALTGEQVADEWRLPPTLPAPAH